METLLAVAKDNKTAGPDGLSAELFETGGNELEPACMHQLL